MKTDSPSIRILHLEDSPLDAELIASKLSHGGLNCDITWVADEARFTDALSAGTFDVILCDYNLVDYDGMTALLLARQMHPVTPVMLISGTLGEEDAVKCLQKGATDYLLKQKLERLPAAVTRALAEAEEQRLHKREQDRNHELAALLDKAHDAIYVRDLDQHITYWNQGAERLYGWTAEEALGKRAIDLLYPRETPELLAVREAVLTEGEWLGELKQWTKDHKEITVMARRNLVRAADGKPVSILNVNTNITERKMLESQLVRAQRAESVASLAGGVAHDLNNTLGPILMATELLRMRYPKDNELVETVALSATRGAEMVRQLMTFAEGVEGERLPVQSRHLLDGMETIVRSAFDKNIQVQTRFAPSLPPVMGDATQLHRVLLNLCFNARDAMLQGGTLTLEAENVKIDAEYARSVPDAKPGNYVLWSISDTGTGMAPEIMDRIFEPFFSTKGPGKGTGLGLSTLVGIVKSHGGFIQVYSTLGQGSTFAVYLPVDGISEEETVTIPALAIDSAFRGNGEAILVADSEPAVRQFARTVLTALNFKVYTAADATEAIVLAKEKPNELHAVIIGPLMPELRGFAFLRVMKRMLPKSEVLVASTRLSETEAEDLRALGIHSVLAKPYDESGLIQALRIALPADSSTSRRQVDPYSETLSQDAKEYAFPVAKMGPSGSLSGVN